MKKLLSCLCVAFLLIACTAKEPANSASEGAAPLRVGLANLNEAAYFSRAVRKSMEKEAAARGWELICLDNRADGAQAVRNADDLISMNVEYVIELNVDASVAGVIMEKFNSANIPVIAVDIPHAGATFFGANNPLQGRMAGEYAGDYINANWGGELDCVVLMTQIASGDFVAPRVTAFPEGLRNKGVTIPEGEIYEIDSQGGDPQIIQQRFSDFLTAHPNYHKIAVTGISESAGTAIYAAAETAGRQNDVCLMSQGCSGEYVETLFACNGETNWIGTVAMFPERYGEYVMPIIENLESGDAVEPEYYFDPVPLGWANVNDYYPLGSWPWQE